MGNYKTTFAYAIVVPGSKPPTVETEGEKNEKISDSIIRHRYYHGNLCLAGSGNGRSRSLIIDPTISLCTETKKTQVLRPVFFCVVSLWPIRKSVIGSWPKELFRGL